MNDNETSRSYVGGFVLSLLFTLTAYFVVVNHVLNGFMLIAAIITLAIAQLVVQLIFFLHLAQESKPRWNLALVVSTISIILVIIIGSLWIMTNLNYNHMTSPEEIEKSIIHDEGIYP